MPNPTGTVVSKGVLGLVTERETRAVLNLRFWFAAGGCTAVPFCCTVLPEVFVEMSSFVLPSLFYSLFSHSGSVGSSLKGLDFVLKVMAHAQKPDFVFRRNGQVHLNRQGL